LLFLETFFIIFFLLFFKAKRPPKMAIFIHFKN
jgi:hypothetical protein